MRNVGCLYQKTILPNGIRVVTESIPYVRRTVSLGFWFLSGSRNETVENNSISHLIEHFGVQRNNKPLCPRK